MVAVRVIQVSVVPGVELDGEAIRDAIRNVADARPGDVGSLTLNDEREAVASGIAGCVGGAPLIVDLKRKRRLEPVP